MNGPANSITAEDLNRLIGTDACPAIIDVRRRKAYDEAGRVIATTRWRDHARAAEWAAVVPKGKPVVVYCVHGHAISQSACALLRAAGVDARYLEGGIDHFVAAGGVTVKKGLAPEDGPSRWVTRERPKIDRIACPWLVRRFVDPDAVFHYVASDFVTDVAKETGAIPYDIPGVDFSHVGEKCSFDAFVAWAGLEDAALADVAEIVRGADTGMPGLAPECAGLLAVSLGLSALHGDDHRMLEAAMAVYDALYAWRRSAAGETHNWVPAKTTVGRA